MRTRKQIESEMPQTSPFQSFGGHGTKYTYEVAIIELLLDIRDLLQKSNEPIITNKMVKSKKNEASH